MALQQYHELQTVIGVTVKGSLNTLKFAINHLLHYNKKYLNSTLVPISTISNIYIDMRGAYNHNFLIVISVEHYCACPF